VAQREERNADDDDANGLDDPFVAWFAGLDGGGGARGNGLGLAGASGSGRSGTNGRARAQADGEIAQPAAPDPHGAWDCDFPLGRAAHARVAIVVTVRPDGTPESVEIVSDPGHGFAPAARECAMRQRFLPARDRDGNPVLGKTRPFTVRYVP
jgi:protein TonB